MAGIPPAGKPGGSSSGGTVAPPSVKGPSAEELAAGVRRSGWPCPAALKSEAKGQIQGPRGPLTTWVLDCSDGQQYTVLVDPRGAMTSFPTPK